MRKLEFFYSVFFGLAYYEFRKANNNQNDYGEPLIVKLIFLKYYAYLNALINSTWQTNSMWFYTFTKLIRVCNSIVLNCYCCICLRMEISCFLQFFFSSFSIYLSGEEVYTMFSVAKGHSTTDVFPTRLIRICSQEQNHIYSSLVDTTESRNITSSRNIFFPLKANILS
jgi:hypothetical protein